jgi:hydrogenase maturation protease
MIETADWIAAPPRVRLLVCGTADRGDDGAAICAAATLLPALSEAQRTLLEVRRCGQLEVDDLTGMPDGMAGLIIDAAVGVTPGAIVTVPFEDLAAGSGGPAPRSSHALPVSQVLALAATLGRLPRGTFVGIGGRRFGFGQGLSRSVRAAMPAYREAIVAEIERLAEAVRAG